MPSPCGHFLYPSCGCAPSSPESRQETRQSAGSATSPRSAPEPPRKRGRPSKAEVAARESREAPAPTGPPPTLVHGLIGPTAPQVLAPPKKPEPPRLVGFKKAKATGRPKTPWLLREREPIVEPVAEPTVEEQVYAAVQVAQADPKATAALLTLFDVECARASLAEFVKQAWHVIEPSTQLKWNWHHQLICNVLQAVFFDWLRTQHESDYVNQCRNVIFNVPPGSLKPVASRTLVQERVRGLLPLGDIRVGDEVLTHLGRFRRVLQVAEHPNLPTLTITTGRGRRIAAEGSHPFLTQRGWIRADELTASDVLSEVHTNEPSGTRTVSLEAARLAGYLVGDGCMQKNSASFTNQDPQTVADFIVCAAACGLDSESRERPPSLRKKASWGTHVVALRSRKSALCSDCNERPRQVGAMCRKCRCRRDNYKRRHGEFETDRERPDNAVGEWLITMDLLAKNSHDKRVPRLVMEGDAEVVAEYLAAYWACDGGIHDRRDLPRNKRSVNVVRVDATTVSEGLARDHQALLSRLGLSFTLRRKTTKLTKAMCGASGERIGQDYTSWLLVASDQDTAAKFMQVIGPRLRHEKRTRAAGLMRNDFDRILNPDIVVSVEPGITEDCRCLQVEEDASFVAGGVAVHNSRLISVLFHAWVWLHWPGMKLICLSVNDDATMRDARDARAVMTSDWYIKNFGITWNFKTDQDAISNYGNTKGGERLSMPSKSVVVGMRGDLICIDDPNDPKSGEDENERKKVNDIWQSTQFNRVNDLQRSLRIGVQQRVNSGDWTGNVIDLQGLWDDKCAPCGSTGISPEGTTCLVCRGAGDNRDGWLWVVLPAEFEDARKFVLPEPLQKILKRYLPAEHLVLEDPRTEEGESIDKERMPVAVLAAERRRWEGTGSYAGQMLQRPALIEGSRIKRGWWGWFRLAGGVRPEVDDHETGRPRPALCSLGEAVTIGPRHHAPGTWNFDWTYLTIDCAAKKTTRGSNWGLLAVAGKEGRRYVLDDRTQRGDILEIIAIMREMCRIWRPDKILIEDKAAGDELKRRLIDEMSKGDMPMITLEPVTVGMDGKEERLDACISALANSMVALRDGAPWLEAFVEEMTLFPNGKRSDRVDALTQVLNYAPDFEADAWPEF